MFRLHKPNKPLIDFVDSIVYSEYNPEHRIERLIPDGSANLIIDLGNSPQYIFDNQNLGKKKEFKKSWISGMQLGYISISANSSEGMMVIRFSPTGAHAILGLPLNELTNQVINADLILGNEIDELREVLIEQPNPDLKFQVLELWLTRRLQESSTPKLAVDHVVNCTDSINSEVQLNEVISETGYSHRHLIQLFKKHVGLSPKQYHRIIRFNKTLALIDNHQFIDWAGLAHQCGYYDQAHFIKEFKCFSGFSPNAFMKEKGEFVNYVPLV